VGRDSSVGKATLYVLDGAGIESVPVAERSKARACGRWLAGVAGSNPTRGHGCLCCTYRQEAKCRIIKTKRTKNDEVQTIREYKKKNPAVDMDVLRCVCCTVRTRIQMPVQSRKRN
jgi:hypothetical protein